jgi:hypothetical protein
LFQSERIVSCKMRTGIPEISSESVARLSPAN